MPFGQIGIKKRYINVDTLSDAIHIQLHQETERNGDSDRIGKIMVDNQWLTNRQKDEILDELSMEPNILWGVDTWFAKSLRSNKKAKQQLGEYLGQEMASTPNSTYLIGGSSTLYYVFLGMVKHKVRAHVITINAAILAAYPSMTSSIQSVSIAWNGNVDVDHAIIVPPNEGFNKRVLPTIQWVIIAGEGRGRHSRSRWRS